MCMRTTCRVCQKPTWSGCGNHVEQVLAGVAPDDRCQCNKTYPAARSTANIPSAQSAFAPNTPWYKPR